MPKNEGTTNRFQLVEAARKMLASAESYLEDRVSPSHNDLEKFVRSDAKSEDFTVDQARDLANYFLGKEWDAVIAPSAAGLEYVLSDTGRQAYRGKNWRQTFRLAGVSLPFRRKFVSVGVSVFAGDDQVARAKSRNYALRIANALNLYTPGPKGY